MAVPTNKSDLYGSLPSKEPVSVTTPLFLEFKPEEKDAGYGSSWPAEMKASGPPAKKHMKSYGGSSISIANILVNLVLPPLAFAYTSTILTFHLHFLYPRMVWALALIALLPMAISLKLMQRARCTGKPESWSRLSAFLFFLAFCMAAAFGDVTFWFFSNPFYFIESLKTYSNINPTQVSGAQLMDAGKVHFADGSRVALDLAMSFTNWDVYCVAPITTREGLPSEGSTLATYDFWAVGVNCCSSAKTDFKCGEYSNMNARSGLRQVGEAQRSFFRLAIQQAEAAYNIRADHPVLFHWVQDPAEEEGFFFQSAFESWILSNCVHMATNTFCLVVFCLMFHRPKDAKHFAP